MGIGNDQIATVMLGGICSYIGCGIYWKFAQIHYIMASVFDYGHKGAAIPWAWQIQFHRFVELFLNKLVV